MSVSGGDKVSPPPRKRNEQNIERIHEDEQERTQECPP